jgi:hypothetical protein
MKKNRRPISKLKTIWSIDFWQGRQECIVGKWYFLQQMVFEELVVHLPKSEIWPLTIYENELKMD